MTGRTTAATPDSTRDCPAPFGAILHTWSARRPTDLERVGDMAKTISRRALQIEGLSLAPKFYNGVKHMSDLILRQLKASLDAYSTRNAQAAEFIGAAM